MADQDEARQEPWFSGGLKFKCTGCGNCCTGASGSVYLSRSDIARLAAFTGLPAGAFVRRYTRLAKGRRVLIDRPGTSDCVFLLDKSCSVYEARPTQCRAYPWWAANIRDAESWQEAALVCEGIDHPSAPVVPAEEILEQCRLDLENEAEPGR